MKARIRLILVVLALVVAPVLAPLSGSAAMPMPVAMAADAGCDQDCACSGPIHGAQHCELCPLACAQHAVTPQMLGGLALPVPAASGLIQPHSRGDTVATAAWPPPLPPPRS